MPLMPVACFAPQLTDEKLKRYRELVSEVPEGTELRDGLNKCLTCVEAWYAIPESKRIDGTKVGLVHQGQDITIQVTPLEDEQIKILWATTPWSRECEPLKSLFDTISSVTDKQLRDCAHDLLWHTIEISLDREPCTQDACKLTC